MLRKNFKHCRDTSEYKRRGRGLEQGQYGSSAPAISAHTITLGKYPVSEFLRILASDPVSCFTSDPDSCFASDPVSLEFYLNRTRQLYYIFLFVL